MKNVAGRKGTSNSINQVLGVILGGGKGTRLYPLTKERSKPAVPFGGNYRLIDIPISNCINSGINRVFVMTQYNSASLNRHIIQTFKFDIFHNGFIDILATEQTMDNANAGFTQGTADAVRRALKHFNSLRDSKSAKYILLLSGDQLYRMDYRNLYENHMDTNADITLGILPVCEDDLPRFGILKIDDHNKVTKFIEKPKNKELVKGWEIPKKFKTCESKNYFGSMGMYLFNIDILYDILLTHPDFLDFGKEVIPYAIENKYNVTGFVHDDYWEDIGTIKTFHTANIELTKENPEFSLHSFNFPFFSHPRFLPPSRIISGKVDSTILSDGVIIEGAQIKNSVIGVRSCIQKGVIMENTFMIGADFYENDEDIASNKEKKIPSIGIGENTVIKNAILDKNCRIGNNVKILNEAGTVNKEEKNYSIVDGIVVITKGAIIPDGTVI